MNVDVRVISATNRNLLADVKSGRFREDLFYRLHVFPIAVPPLRERPEDIPGLIRHFLVRFCAEEGKTVKAVSGEAIAFLRGLPWPGNVRQLENAVFRAVVLAETDEIGLHEFPQLAGREPAPSDASASLVPDQSERRASDDHPELNALYIETTAQAAFQPDRMALLDAASHVRPLEELEAEIIRYAIAHYRGQMSEVARRLRIGRSTLYRKLDGLGATDITDRSEKADPVAVE
jgi:DNA-binding NtrC family response regulator